MSLGRVFKFSRIYLCLWLAAAGCGSKPNKSGATEFFGRVQPPARQVLRYISGAEPESLDPQICTAQTDARIDMALFTGLVELHPQTAEPIPELAERWTISPDMSQFTFFLRHGVKWSNGDPLNARDFLYSFRRGVAPALAARNAYLAYEIKYAQAFNEALAFVRDRKSGSFLENDSPQKERLTVPADSTEREKMFAANPTLKAACEGKEFVPVKAEDIGVEALDDYTFRITLRQSAPYFLGLLTHQFFRAVPRKTIEKYGDQTWTRPKNIVTCGPFRLAEWKPYDLVVVKRDPIYWDAARVKLEEIRFYPLEDATTMLNLYKAGAVDATFNHTVPIGWLGKIKSCSDWMDAPEICTEYYGINTTKGPTKDLRVRKALNMAIDKVALAKYRKTLKPPVGIIPVGIFPEYPYPKADDFNPEKAQQLLAEAGYATPDGKYDPSKFPLAEVELTYNTSESNRQVAEFVQAQWKQNLALTIPLKNMEFKTFLQIRAKLEYNGVVRDGWVGDYLDPYSFLALFSTDSGENGTGWYDIKYVRMLQEANRQLDKRKRFELLAKAESYMLAAQPIIALGTTSTSWMKKPYVKGMYPNPLTLHPWKFVYIENDRRRWDYGVPSLKRSEAVPRSEL